MNLYDANSMGQKTIEDILFYSATIGQVPELHPFLLGNPRMYKTPRESTFPHLLLGSLTPDILLKTHTNFM